VRFLFDHNLSPSLVDRLSDLFPSSTHVFHIQLEKADDVAVWTYARNNDFVIVTKDADYNDLSLIFGFPPKVIWIRRGNCSTIQIEAMLRSNSAVIKDLDNEANLGVLTLF